MSVKRRYDSTARRAAADERRQRIAAAAATRFAERGWSSTTLADVAADAGVSVELVSTAFGGKAGLFMAAFRQAGFGAVKPLPEAFADLGLEAEPDHERRVDLFVGFCVDAVERLSPLVAVLAVGADQDPELRRLMDDARRGHLVVVRQVFALLAGAEVGPDAVDELYVTTLSETYREFRLRGWTQERYAAWLRRTLERLLEPARVPSG